MISETSILIKARRLLSIGGLLLLTFAAVAQDAPSQGAQETKLPSTKTQLMRAARDGQVDEVRALLSAGGDASAALWAAALWGRAEVAEVALEFGAVLMGPDQLGQRALSMALSCSNKAFREGSLKVKSGEDYDEIIALLLDRGVPADSTNELGMSPLHEAALWGNAKAAALFLGHGAKPDRQLSNGETALWGAALLGHGSVVEELVKAGASVDKASDHKITPLQAASCAGAQDAVALVNGGPSEAWGWTKRMKGKDYLRAVRALLGANASVDESNDAEVTPLMAAARAGDLGIATLLLDAGARPNDADKLGRTPLMFAALSGNAQTVELLLARNADPKVVALDGATALSLGKQGKSTEIVRILKKTLTRRAREASLERPSERNAQPTATASSP